MTNALKIAGYGVWIAVVVLLRATYIFVVTTLLALSWAVYNVVTFNTIMLFTRVPWRVKVLIMRDYCKTVLRKVVELNCLTAMKKLFSLSSRSSIVSGSYHRVSENKSKPLSSFRFKMWRLLQKARNHVIETGRNWLHLQPALLGTRVVESRLLR